MAKQRRELTAAEKTEKERRGKEDMALNRNILKVEPAKYTFVKCKDIFRKPLQRHGPYLWW